MKIRHRSKIQKFLTNMYQSKYKNGTKGVKGYLGIDGKEVKHSRDKWRQRPIHVGQYS